MTTEELLKERYEVIAPWPGMENNNTLVGDIITLPSENWLYCDNQYCEPDYFDAYPSNFRRLPWYHGRKIEEMPEYVNEGGFIMKVTSWYYVFDQLWGFTTGSQSHILATNILPALESDYITFINREKDE